MGQRLDVGHGLKAWFPWFGLEGSFLAKEEGWRLPSSGRCHFADLPSNLLTNMKIHNRGRSLLPLFRREKTEGGCTWVLGALWVSRGSTETEGEGNKVREGGGGAATLSGVSRCEGDAVSIGKGTRKQIQE